MNHRQKIVQEQFLNNEEAVIKRLKQVYNQSLKDITSKSQALQDDINRLGTLANLATDAEEKATFLSMQQSKVYQKQYQDALKKQIGSVLDNMQVEEFKTVSEYLTTCYEDGFIGTMFDLQGQGIPLCFPLDQEAMVRAVQLDSKISQGLYSRLGEDVTLLKKKITAQVSRGIATGQSFQHVAQQLSAYTNIGYNNAIRIARTEGHRIQNQAGMDACYKAKDMGADVVKQWDATLDDSTRESHVAVDGEIRELDERFSNGLMFPGDPSGGASEVVNCRCALLQRARWALDEAELQTLQDRAEFFGLDKADTFEDYKKKYLKAAEGLENSQNSDIILNKRNNMEIDDLFNINDIPKDVAISPESVYSDLLTSDIGRDALSVIENLPEKPVFDYTSRPADGHRGEEDRGRIKVFLLNCKDAKTASCVLIHECTHYKYGIGQSQWAECVCVAKELMHRRNRNYLTIAEKRKIITAVKEVYPEYNWRNGGIINGRKIKRKSD